MARLKSELVVELKDRVSANARDVEQSLRRMHDTADRQVRNAEAARGRVLDAAAMAYVAYEAFSRPIGAAIEFQEQLTQIGFKADLTREKLVEMGKVLRAQGLATGRGASNQVETVNALISKGLSPEQSIAAAEQIGYAAFAYGVAEEDLANAVGALLLSGGITFDQIGLALDVMARSGIQGQAEIEDMAAEFPALVAAAASLGYSGIEGLRQFVTWLQIARDGTSTASEATTNLSDYMMKLQAPDVVKNFADMGVDITKELEYARANGIDPVLHSLGIINRLTEGGKGDLVAQLFGEKNSLMFLQKALPGIEKALGWQQELVDARGTVAADFQERMETPAGVFERLQASIENLNLIVGEKIVPRLADLAEKITPMIDGIASFTEANGELVAALLEMVAAIVALRVAAAAIGFGGAVLGVGGKALPAASGAGTSAAASAGGWLAGATGAGAGIVGALMRGLGLYELAKFKEEHVAPTLLPDPNQSIERNILNQLDPTLAKWIYGEIDPIQNMSEQLQRIPEIPFASGDFSEQAAAIRQMIADAESGAVPTHPMELNALRDELAAIEGEAASAGQRAGQNLETGLAAQLPSVKSRMKEFMQALRVLAATGVNIPIRTTGAAIPQAPDRTLPQFATGGWVDGAGTSTSDSVPAYLSRGEFVVNAASAGRFGGLLEAVNAGYPADALMAATGGSSGRAAAGMPGAITISPTFHVTAQGMSDPHQFVDQMMPYLIQETTRMYRDVHSGIQADIEYDIA